LKIVILGCGEVGQDLAGILSQEKHDVIVLDRDKDALSHLQEKHDVLTVEGTATSVRDLIRCEIPEADIVVAATSVDEVNMIASMLSKRLGAKTVIARVRNNELTRPEIPLSPADLGIDVMIHPEYSAAREILQLIKRAAATDVVSLANDQLQIIGIRIDKDSNLVGKSLVEYAQGFPDLTFRLVAINRGSMTIIPYGSHRLQANDQIFIIARTQDVTRIIQSTGRLDRPIHNIMIAGGSGVGAMVAKMLATENQGWKIKLIEPDYDKAYELAIECRNIMVLHGNPTDPDLLATEGIADMHAFIAVTDDEESNIISCLMAKHMNVSKTVALVSKPEYIPLSATIGLDAAINKKLAASNEIHRYVRSGNVISAITLHGIKAEAVELICAKDAKLAGRPLSDIRLPHGCVVGAVVKGHQVEIATGHTVIEGGNTVIIFALPEAIEEISQLLS
jgi:trk system potassium uptake protein TrkA